MPETIKTDLAAFFNKNSNSSYVKEFKANKSEELTDEIYLGILKPGYHFMLGSIKNGTTNVKHFCERHQIDYPETENCGFDLNKK